MKKLAILMLVSIPASAQVIKQNGGVASTISPSVVNASTVTITGTGAKCFSVDDPTMVVDCNLNRVGIGIATPKSKLNIKGATNVNLNIDASGSVLDIAATDDANSSLIALQLRGSSMYLNPSGGAVGVGTSSPATTLDVNGNTQFGSGATKSTFTATGFWEPISKTRAQIDTLVPTKIGQVIYASDTTLPGLCISTGTLAAQWRKMESATLGCGTGN